MQSILATYICMSGCTTLVNMALGGIGHTHTQTRFSNVRTEMRCPQRPPTPNKPSTIGKFSVHRWAWRQKSSASSKESSIAVLMKLGSGCQNCRRSMGGRNDYAMMGAVGVCGAGWSMGMVKALLGTREWVWDGKLESLLVLSHLRH
jgi:hypothetical protein